MFLACLIFGPSKHKDAMKTYRNANFTKRNYDCTNVVMCQTEGNPKEQGDMRNINWTETEEAVPANMTQLWVCQGVRYFGYL